MLKWLRGGARIAALLALPAFTAQAADGISLEVGRGRNVDLARAGVQSAWSTQWLRGDTWHVGAYTDFSVGHWKAHSVLPGQNKSLLEAAVTPTLRLQQNSRQGVYGEAGFGPHLLSKTSINSTQLGSALQFGTHLGAGYRFGSKSAFDLSVKVQHISNGGITKPNDGINFSQVRLQYAF
jgi:hypothetical protein